MQYNALYSNSNPAIFHMTADNLYLIYCIILPTLHIYLPYGFFFIASAL